MRDTTSSCLSHSLTLAGVFRVGELIEQQMVLVGISYPLHYLTTYWGHTIYCGDICRIFFNISNFKLLLSDCISRWISYFFKKSLIIPKLQLTEIFFQRQQKWEDAMIHQAAIIVKHFQKVVVLRVVHLHAINVLKINVIPQWPYRFQLPQSWSQWSSRFFIEFMILLSAYWSLEPVPGHIS